jgi:hypothetical protein
VTARLKKIAGIERVAAKYESELGNVEPRLLGS